MSPRSPRTLRLALVGGPMYDGLYDILRGRDVEVAVHADHPTLNRLVADLLDRGERIDVLSTHSKYAPSQSRWLRPLDGLVDVTALAPKAVKLCKWQGELLCAPRNIDVRILWVRSDLVDHAPRTWQELVEGRASFGFPGRESGLFGTFFEIVTAHGGRLFDEHGTPTLSTEAAEQAVEMLCRLGARAPEDLPSWHYDDVDAALIGGRVAIAAAWPGGYRPLTGSSYYGRLEPHPYLSGPAGWFSYSGCHGWAIPATCRDVRAAADLVNVLCSEEANRLETRGGAVCAHVSAFAGQEPDDEKDARRLEITRETVDLAMITYPPLARFPEVEDAGWSAINAALRGELTPAEATAEMQRVAEAVLF